MRKVVLFVVVACLVCLALPLAAQEEAEPGTVGMLVWAKAKPGATQQFEEGVKKHFEFHRSQNDPWTWEAWQVLTGKRTGEYLFGTFDHHWADFDNMPVPKLEDQADIQANITPHAGPVMVQYLSSMPKHSRPPEGSGPSLLAAVYTIILKPGMAESYLNAVRKLPEALSKADSSIHYYFEAIANGGHVPSFYVVVPYEKWADLQESGKTFEVMLTEAYGAAEARSVMRALEKAVASETSMMLLHRPDLSYRPATE